MTEFGIEFVPRDLYWKTTYYAIQAEKTGFTYLWITDHFNNRNVYVALSIVSAYTDKIKFGPGVTNPYFFHPVVTAQAVASLNEIAPGRVICGLGAGDKTTLKMVNIRQKNPLSTIREAVQIIREVTSGKNMEFDGEVFNISGAKLNFRMASPIPIFIGAQGPKMLMLAGEVGDGVLINAASPKDVENALLFIRKGSEKAGKRMKEDLDIGVYTSFSVAQEKEKAMKAVTPVVAYIVAGCPEIVLERHGISVESSNKIGEAIVHGKWKDVFSHVTPEMVEAFSICGTPAVCIEKIDKLLKLGITQLVVGSPIGPNVRKSINTIAVEIFPHFRTD
ncbi:MAG: 5,10-methylenetetrahydromethanopterin reductase [Candidatus Bathyarchaeota archaeon]|nr:5,10-methylenetetrahydromethanopterin reductase [Candidatus Bathyarchaeota archaeon]MDH5732863.1 5,10-methylenetetrahydromethanopterin reductase [Candidatus Bathyarchaeota archaeon]